MVEQQMACSVLIGFESCGKSALFRGLTGKDTGEESNFRGSTLIARKGLIDQHNQIIDLPGIKGQDDSITTREALLAINEADTIILVVRSTHTAIELPLLLDEVKPKNKHIIVVLTFFDKITKNRHQLHQYYEDWLGVPVVSVDAREINQVERTQLLDAIREAAPIRAKAAFMVAPNFPIIEPQKTIFEHLRWGKIIALIVTLLLFSMPVYIAYLFSSWLQPTVDSLIIDKIKLLLDPLRPWIQLFTVGDYGIITLGIYSFLWAFPVVFLLGLSIALAEESGVKDRITDSLDGWMRKIGLNGRDLIPYLSGFGCNVVAVFQTRACSSCTRKSCISLITFGSACSYQIGASLSIFSSAGHPWLFIPYLLLLMIVGAWHTRIWNRKSTMELPITYETKTFLQVPRYEAVLWRVKSVVKQFLLQAMPIFLVICVAASLLQLVGVMEWLSQVATPVLQLFQIPAGAASSIIFSILRKDGLLILNQTEGEFLQSLSPGQIFTIVYLASTLTACLVTLWTVRKELGWQFSLSLTGKQVITSLISTGLITLFINL